MATLTPMTNPTGEATGPASTPTTVVSADAARPWRIGRQIMMALLLAALVSVTVRTYTTLRDPATRAQ